MSYLFTDYAARYRAGISPAVIVAETYARIAAHNDPALFIHLLPEAEAQRYAAALIGRDPATLPLFGIPFVIKDNIDLAGVPTTAGCPAFSFIPTQHATVVERLIGAGAIPIGKTNLDQFATGLVGVRSPYGVPRNPLHKELIPGGSSSGSACAVAAGLVPFALGTDTAGSGRVPAAMCNIVGIKPSCGVISTRGVVPAVRSLDCVSIFANCVSDARQVFSVAAYFDAGDEFARIIPSERPYAAPLRIGIPDEATLNLCSAAQKSAFMRACNELRDNGAQLHVIDYAPLAAVAKSLYGGAWVAERTAAVGEFISAHADACDPVVGVIITGGQHATAVTAHRDRYALMSAKRTIDNMWTAIHALLLPTIPDHPTISDIRADPIARNSRLGTFTNFANLLDTAAVTVPVGRTEKENIHGSVTFFAPAGNDALIAEIAADLHARLGHGLGNNNNAVIPLAKQPSPKGIALGVIGAHLRGFPLHQQLINLGARFERLTQTAPKYRFYDLGTTPPKPGLVRVADSGFAIEIEIYRLDPASFGRFVAAIPAPLGIGQVELTDGSFVCGFLCEAIAVKNCTDISASGGWRGYWAEKSSPK
jgi:allophanate hydrolase